MIIDNMIVVLNEEEYWWYFDIVQSSVNSMIQKVVMRGKVLMMTLMCAYLGVVRSVREYFVTFKHEGLVSGTLSTSIMYLGYMKVVPLWLQNKSTCDCLHCGKLGATTSSTTWCIKFQEWKLHLSPEWLDHLWFKHDHNFTNLCVLRIQVEGHTD